MSSFRIIVFKNRNTLRSDPHNVLLCNTVRSAFMTLIDKLMMTLMNFVV